MESYLSEKLFKLSVNNVNYHKIPEIIGKLLKILTLGLVI